MDKIYFFIDGSNFYKGIKNQGFQSWDATHIDLNLFCSSLIKPEDQKLIRIYYYDAPIKQEWDNRRYRTQQQFFNRLRSQDKIELKLGRLEGKYPDDIKEKGIDVQLATDLIRFAYNNSYEIGIIISADGDYTPAIQLAKDMGKNIYNVYFAKRASYHLKRICDKFIPIEKNLIKNCQLQKKLFSK